MFALAHLRPPPSSSMNQAAAAGILLSLTWASGSGPRSTVHNQMGWIRDTVLLPVSVPPCWLLPAGWSLVSGEPARASWPSCSHAPMLWPGSTLHFYQAVACAQAVGVGMPLKILDMPQSTGASGTVDWRRLARLVRGCGRGCEPLSPSVSRCLQSRLTERLTNAPCLHGIKCAA